MRHFVEELDQLSNMLLEMCSCVEAAVQRSISAVTEKDIYAAEEVLSNEARINQMLFAEGAPATPEVAHG